MVLEIPSKDLTPEETEFLEAMSTLQQNPLFRLLAESVEGERDRYLRNLANTIAFTGGEHAEPVNQRVVDYKRGFWNGAVYAVTQYPKRKAKDWEKFVVEATKESDGT